VDHHCLKPARAKSARPYLKNKGKRAEGVAEEVEHLLKLKALSSTFRTTKGKKKNQKKYIYQIFYLTSGKSQERYQKTIK
jgi:hypothetical protein